MMVRLVDGMKDCANVHSVAGLNTESYSIQVSVLVALVGIISSEIDFSFCVIVPLPGSTGLVISNRSRW